MRLGMAVVLLTAVLSYVQAVVGQELFYQVYEEGIKAFDAGQLDLAAQRFDRALQLDSAQNRQKRYYGMTFRPYIPEFYLGLIAVRQKQYQRALDLFGRVEKAGLLRKGDKDYERLIAERTTASNAAASATAVAANTQPPPARTPTPPPPTAQPSDTGARTADTGAGRIPPQPPAVAKVEEPVNVVPPPSPPPRTEPVPPAAPPASPDVRTKFDALVRQRDYEQAWSVAGQMGAGAGSAYTQARAALGKDIQDRVASGDIREAERLLGMAGRVMKGDRDVARFTQLVNDGRASLAAERQAFTLLLKGDYRQSIDVGTALATEKKASRRLLFYMACSHAGMALESPKNDSADHIKAARDLYTRATADPAITSAHARYISPQILQLLAQRPQ